MQRPVWACPGLGSHPGTGAGSEIKEGIFHMTATSYTIPASIPSNKHPFPKWQTGRIRIFFFFLVKSQTGKSAAKLSSLDVGAMGHGVLGNSKEESSLVFEKLIEKEFRLPVMA